MKRGIYIFVVISLLLGLMGVFGCSAGKEIAGGNTPEVGSLSMVVQMNGKKLAVGTPTIERAWALGASYPGMVTAVIKNSGREPIALAELELVAYDSDGLEPEFSKCDKSRLLVSVKELSAGEVQTLYWGVSECRNPSYGSFKVNVKRLE